MSRRLQDPRHQETPSTEQKEKEKKPVPGNKDELLQWSGAATFPRKCLPESRASVSLDQSQFLPSCAHGTGSSQLPSPQVKRQNNGHDHPQEEDKGKPGLHKSPYAAKQKKGKYFNGRTQQRKTKGREGCENDYRSQREADSFPTFFYTAGTATHHILGVQTVLKIGTKSGPQITIMNNMAGLPFQLKFTSKASTFHTCTDRSSDRRPQKLKPHYCRPHYSDCW